ncbi:MAG: phosphoribosyl-AMP cyclohydrolase [Nitrososphaerota archaeon]
MTIRDELSVEDLEFARLGGLIVVVVQDAMTKDVLMVAFANKEAILRTMKEKIAYFWSRSRNKLWMKGETSGNILQVEKILVDCDADSVIYLVKPRGPACHTGKTSCFYRTLRE